MFTSESVHKICKVNLINGIIARVRCIFKIYHSFIILKVDRKILKEASDILSPLNGFTINSNFLRWGHEIGLTSYIIIQNYYFRAEINYYLPSQGQKLYDKLNVFLLRSVPQLIKKLWVCLGTVFE